MEENSTIRRLGAFLLDILQTVVLALAVFLIIYMFLFQPHQVRGQSMSPNFEDREYLLTDKISYRFGSPKRGDVIVFTAPPRPSEDFIKRIIGLPGETVMIKDGSLFINSKKLIENYLPQDLRTNTHGFMQDGEQITLGSDEYFVLGDNRNNSSDSREWGPVKRNKIVGKAWFVYWPPKRFGLIP